MNARIALALLFAASPVVSSGTQSPEPTVQAPAPTVFGTEVVLVALPVFVTDGSGRGVPGLTAADFEVEDGGRVVPIRAFQAVDVAEPLLESVELPNPVRAAMPRQFLLLFDLQFSPFVGIQKARPTTARFVREGLAPGDLVAVATYGRRGFNMLTNFTTDHEYVARAVERLGPEPAQALGADALALTGDLTSPAPVGDETGNAALMDQEIAAQMAELTSAARVAYAGRFKDFVNTLEEVAEALSRLSGRKQVILLSAGANESAWRQQESDGPGSLSSVTITAITASDAVARMVRAAGLHDVAIHTVNLAGLEGPIDAGSQSGQSAVRRSGYDTLAAFAENTGGRFVLPRGDFGKALSEVEQASRRYYVLAFEPAEPGGKRDRPRPLKVRVRRSGLTLSHRTAYLLRPPSTDPGQLRLAAAEAIAKGLSGGPLGLDVVAVPYRDGGGASSLSAVLQIGGGALLAAARGPRLDVEVYGYAMSRDRVLDRLAVKTSIDLAKREAAVRRDGLSVVTTFAVPPGSVDLRFFVRAGSEPQTGSTRRLVQVPPAPAAGELAASPPLLVRPLGDRMAFPAQTQAHRGGPPFRVGEEILLPVAAALAPGKDGDLLVFVWRAGASGRPLDVTGEITGPGQAALPLHVNGVRVVPGPDGVDRCVVSVAAPEAPPGHYSLTLFLRDRDTGQSVRTQTAVSLRR